MMITLRTSKNPSRPPKTPFLRLSKKVKKGVKMTVFSLKFYEEGGQKRTPWRCIRPKKNRQKSKKSMFSENFSSTRNFFSTSTKIFFYDSIFFLLHLFSVAARMRFRIEISLFSDPSFQALFSKKRSFNFGPSTTKVLRSDANTSVRCSIDMSITRCVCLRLYAFYC